MDIDSLYRYTLTSAIASRKKNISYPNKKEPFSSLEIFTFLVVVDNKDNYSPYKAGWLKKLLIHAAEQSCKLMGSRYD